MNRIIKFRGKSVDGLCYSEDGWLYGCYLFQNGKPQIVSMAGLFQWHIIPETLGQFIGLHDRNGKEIYEGDILKTPKYWKDMDYWKGDDFRYYYIKWFDGTNSVFYGFHEVQCNLSEEELEEEKHYRGIRVGCNLAGNAHHFEVIGNIHDNKDLITTK
jgi:uncharacterized phage protein (TIGR01671 family)